MTDIWSNDKYDFVYNGVEVPYRFRPKPYQVELWDALTSDDDRNIYLMAHRKFGKEVISFCYMLYLAWRKPGEYYYLFPKERQSGKVLLQGGLNVDDEYSDGRTAFIDFIPEEAAILSYNGKKFHEQKQLIKLKNGSNISIMGWDGNQGIQVGTNPRFMVISEYAQLDNPTIMAEFGAVIRQNKGRFLINSTPRARDHHFYKIGIMADHQPKHWNKFVITNHDTHYYSEDDIDRMRAEGTSEEKIMLDIYCEYPAGTERSYYFYELKKLREEGREKEFEVPENALVETYWDMGMSDKTCIWFAFKSAGYTHFFDYYENNRCGYDFYAELLSKLNYNYLAHFFPHDMNQSRKDVLLKYIEVMQQSFKRHSVKGQLFVSSKTGSASTDREIVRQAFPRFIFHSKRCLAGLIHLEDYKRSIDRATGEYKDVPEENSAVDCADALKSGIMSYAKDVYVETKKRKKQGLLSAIPDEINFDGIKIKRTNRPSRLRF